MQSQKEAVDRADCRHAAPSEKRLQMFVNPSRDLVDGSLAIRAVVIQQILCGFVKPESSDGRRHRHAAGSVIHLNHLYPYPDAASRPEISLIVGALASDGYRLVTTSLTTVTKVWNYEAVGVGSPLANCLIKRIYLERIPVTRQCSFPLKS